MSLTWTVEGQICGRSGCGTLSRPHLSTPSRRKDFPLETNTKMDQCKTAVCESDSVCVMGWEECPESYIVVFQGHYFNS